MPRCVRKWPPRCRPRRSKGWNVAFLESALLGRGPLDQPVMDLAASSIREGAAASVLRLVEVLERVGDRRLQEFLAGHFRRRLGEDPPPESIDKLAEALRRKFSGAPSSASAPPADRQQAFSRRAAELLAGVSATDDNKNQLLQEVLELAHGNTLACALAQGAPGHAAFDQLTSEGPVRLAPAAGAGPKPRGKGRAPRAAPLQTSESANCAAAEKDILSWRNNTRQWLVGLPMLAQYATMRGVSDISLEPAYKVAEYLLAARTQTEHDTIMKHIKDLARWPHVRLGLADQLDGAKATSDQLRERLAAVLGEEVHGGLGVKWQDKARLLLLKQVADELPKAGLAGRARRWMWRPRRCKSSSSSRRGCAAWRRRTWKRQKRRA